jgi:hypothetical protein
VRSLDEGGGVLIAMVFVCGGGFPCRGCSCPLAPYRSLGLSKRVYSFPLEGLTSCHCGRQPDAEEGRCWEGFVVDSDTEVMSSEWERESREI